jgi:glucose dehydrogenase
MSNKSSVLRPTLCAVLLAAGAAVAQTPPPAAAPALAGANAATPPPPPAPESIQVRPITANVTVTDQQLLNANSDQNNWLLYGRTYDNQRFSPLTQINSGNVKRLTPVAIIQTGIANSFEDTPIVVNGVMYVVTPTDHVMAYDAVTGDPLWVYNPVLGYTRLCCGPQARGVAVAYGKVFVGRVDGVMVALDARTGKVVWQSDPATTLPDQPTLFSFTAAPQVYDGMVVTGTGGAEYPIRGFVQAYDAQTGKVIWRFRTTAAPDEPGGNSWSGDSWKTGGGSVWNSPAFDPAQGMISFAVGNPNPDIRGEDRAGDNAYTDSIVALNAKDGKLKWWYQQVPHDVWDWDSAGPVLFFDAPDASGHMVPAAAEANKQGYLYIVNRQTGALLRRSDPLGLQSRNMMDLPTLANDPRYPAASGGAEWSPPSYSPLTHDVYVNAANVAWIFTTDANNGANPNGQMRVVLDDKTPGSIEPSGTLSAVDVATGKIAWQYKSDFPMIGGTLATAGNLVFTGELNGYFDAFDAKSGAKLWHFNLGAGVNASPITYRVNGVQYVAVAAGGNSGNSNNRLAALRGYAPAGDNVAIFAMGN